MTIWPSIHIGSYHNKSPVEMLPYDMPDLIQWYDASDPSMYSTSGGAFGDGYVDNKAGVVGTVSGEEGQRLHVHGGSPMVTTPLGPNGLNSWLIEQPEVGSEYYSNTTSGVPPLVDRESLETWMVIQVPAGTLNINEKHGIWGLMSTGAYSIPEWGFLLNVLDVSGGIVQLQSYGSYKNNSGDWFTTDPADCSITVATLNAGVQDTDLTLVFRGTFEYTAFPDVYLTLEDDSSFDAVFTTVYNESFPDLTASYQHFGEARIKPSGITFQTFRGTVQIGEQLIFNNSLGSQERADVRAYLQNKWGV